MKLNRFSNRQLEILEDLSGENAAEWRTADDVIEVDSTENLEPRQQLALVARQLSYADLAISPTIFIILSGVLGFVIAFGVSRFLSPKLIPIYFLVGASIPWLYVERRIKDRANRFTEDYSTMLMAAASSIKVGLTPYHALERSVQLLPKESLVKTEVSALLAKLKRGDSRDKSIDEFAVTIRQPDVELFRSAFKLVLENGGRFAPTLARLASVSYGRMSLIRSALVSTANMRMTANCLLIAAPVMLVMMSVKTPNYWQTLFNNPQANIFASVGVLMILGSYAVLRHFSNFKP